MNYQNITDKIIKKHMENNSKPTLLIHSCCAPCSSYVLEYLSSYFKITILYYNPNIYPKIEFDKRVVELKNLINKMNLNNEISLIIPDYDSMSYFESIKGLEKEKEGGKRCYKCYKLRLEKTALYAKENNFDYFTTTLSISPHKNSKVLNEIGALLEENYQINYLYSDFKKKNGYKRSIELSKKYNLYRQDYCGCIFSKKERGKLNVLWFNYIINNCIGNYIFL